MFHLLAPQAGASTCGVAVRASLRRHTAAAPPGVSSSPTSRVQRRWRLSSSPAVPPHLKSRRGGPGNNVVSSSRDDPGREAEKRAKLEAELKDPTGPVGYLLPRGIRKVLFGFSAFASFVGTLLAVAKVAGRRKGSAGSTTKRRAGAPGTCNSGQSAPSLDVLVDGELQSVAINAGATALFAALLVYDSSQEQQRVADRAATRERQLERGDRVVVQEAEGGGEVTRLKPVDDEWILKRLDRWGASADMPFLGPTKAGILRQLVEEARPATVVEVGTLAGYSAIVAAQAGGPNCAVVTIERDWLWVLVAKRFLWQANGEGGKRPDGKPRVGERVRVEWGDALEVLPKLAARGVRADFLFLDGVPKEYLAYLQAATPLLNPGATVVADNAGVFKESLAGYLEYVRDPEGAFASSRFVEASFGYRGDVPDGMEVSILK